MGEATARLAEAEKAQAQAAEVIAEINASVEKDQKEFEATIKAQTQLTLDRQAAASDKLLKELEEKAGDRVESYIREQSVSRGLRELMGLSDKQKAKFMDLAIASL